ncbi:recombinase family protein [Paenibacillus koleovorans]|uniref:recombinase family protein n=1 Tax=Paenibacillus koleovorans TaxID=121608 RepID=UPI001FE2C601|nr:recombinase family protein [Paenibacillus koleovorans]
MRSISNFQSLTAAALPEPVIRYVSCLLEGLCRSNEIDPYSSDACHIFLLSPVILLEPGDQLLPLLEVQQYGPEYIEKADISGFILYRIGCLIDNDLLVQYLVPECWVDTDIEKKIFDIVIVHKLDRFSRDKYDNAYYKRILKKNRVQLISITEKLDDSPESLILESVIEGMAAYYSKNLAREVMKGMKETAYQCKHTGGRPPIGYSVDPATKKYIINAMEKPIVETVFSMYLDGYGYNQILAELNDKGYRARTGRPIGKNTLLEILKNEKYTGVYVFNLTDGKDAFGQRNSNRKKSDEDIIRIEDGMPAIISKEDFQKAQEKINFNKRAPGAYKAKEMYLLSGLTICGGCLKKLGQEFSMMGNVKYCGRNKLKYVTYRCGNRDRTKECKNKELRREYIESYVLHEWNAASSTMPPYLTL